MLMTVGSIAVKRSHFYHSYRRKVAQQLRQRIGVGTHKELLAATPVSSRPLANNALAT
jgi:hypothetical protein